MDIEVTHPSKEDHDAFIKSIETYDNPSYDWNERVETRTNHDGSITTTLNSKAIRDAAILRQNYDLTGGKNMKIGTND